MIAIIDYGVGNIQSVKNAFEYWDSAVAVVKNPHELKNYSKIVLPGVGAFGSAMEDIRKKKFDEAIVEAVKKNRCLFGICLGMQLLATKSYEHGEHYGLNLIEGEVVNFKEVVKNLKVPHMGWGEVEFLREDKLAAGIGNKSDFYFVHSYFFKCKYGSDVLGVTEYGIKFASVVNKGNVYGIQFHPEKSQEAGLRIIKNFIDL